MIKNAQVLQCINTLENSITMVRALDLVRKVVPAILGTTFFMYSNR